MAMRPGFGDQAIGGGFGLACATAEKSSFTTPPPAVSRLSAPLITQAVP